MLCYGSPSLTGMAGRVCSKQKKNNYSSKLQKKPFALARALVVSFLIILVLLVARSPIVFHVSPWLTIPQTQRMQPMPSQNSCSSNKHSYHNIQPDQKRGGLFWKPDC